MTTSLALLSFASCSKEIAKQPPAPIPTVVAAEVRSTTIPIYGEYVGKTEPDLFVEIRARVDGFVKSILFRDGALVEKDTLLFEIDARQHTAAVEVLRGKVSQEEAKLERMQRNLKRLKPLFEENAVSRKDYDDALSDVQEAEAMLASGLAELEQEKLELEFCQIKSPLTGVLGESAVDVGALVGSRGVSLLTVVQKIDPILVRFNMTPNDLEQLKESNSQDVEPTKIERWQSVSISLPGGQQYRYKGDIKFADPEIDPNTGTFAVQAALPNPKGILRPGQFTRVRLRLGWRANAIFVPQRAVLAGQGGSYVLVISEENRVEQRWVVIDRPWKNDFVLREGVKPGERVVAEGGHKLRSGQMVRIVDKPVLPTKDKTDTEKDPEPVKGK